MTDLQMIKLEMNQFHTLTFQAMASDIIKPSAFNAFRKCFDEEIATQRDYNHEITVAHFYGAVTRQLRGGNMRLTQQRSMGLSEFLSARVIDRDLVLDADLIEPQYEMVDA